MQAKISDRFIKFYPTEEERLRNSPLDPELSARVKEDAIRELGLEDVPDIAAIIREKIRKDAEEKFREPEKCKKLAEEIFGKQN